MTNHITIDGRTIDSTFVFERTEGDDLAYQTALLDFFRDEEKVPLSKLAKYYLNENLNFLSPQIFPDIFYFWFWCAKVF